MNPTADLLLIIGSIYHLGFALFHLGFWRIFGWKKDLARLQPINSAVMPVLNICLMFVFLAVAYLSFFCRADLAGGSLLGKTILGLIAGFWLVRAVLQYVYFSRTLLISHILFVVFLAGAGGYLTVLLLL